MDEVEMQGQPPKRKRGRPKKQESNITFVGFTQASIHNKYFRMPAIWIDVCAEIDNLAELKVVQYVLRHTWGHRDYGTAKHITVDEFVNGRKYKHGEHKGKRMDSGTGLSESAVRDGLERGIRHGFLVCYVDDHDKARIDKYYALKMQDESEELQPPEEEYYPEEDEEVLDDCEVFNKHGEVFIKYPDAIKQIPRTEERTLEQTYKNKSIRMASISPDIAEEKIRYLPTPEQRKGKSHVPAFLRDALESLSRDLGDHDHIPSNISQANSLYEASGIDPDAFLAALYEAKTLAQKASIKKVNSKGWPNRMPYFFKCLKQIVTSHTEEETQHG